MGFGFCPEVVLGLVFLNDGLVYKTVAHAKLADKMIVNCRYQALTQVCAVCSLPLLGRDGHDARPGGSRPKVKIIQFWVMVQFEKICIRASLQRCRNIGKYERL